MTAQAPATMRSGAGLVLRVYASEAKYEFLKLWRQPAYVIPTLAFPTVFYLMFGILLNGGQRIGGVGVATYMLATYGTFAVMAASLFGFAIGVATERGYGWLQVKRASPMPPFAYLAAKTLMSMLFGAIVLAVLAGLGAALGGVRMPVATELALFGVLVAGAIPFCGLGLVLGCVASPNASPAIANLVCLPMSFCSGLWIPLPMLPSAVQHAARFLPAYHLGQLALGVAGAPTSGTRAEHGLALAGFSVVFLALALWRFRRDDLAIYG